MFLSAPQSWSTPLGGTWICLFSVEDKPRVGTQLCRYLQATNFVNWIIFTLQAASCGLGAAGELYAHRVDALHSDTHKLASGVVNADNDTPDDVTAKKRERKARATIAKNLADINLTKFDLEFDVDPLFKKTSALFNSEGVGNNCLLNLLTKDDSCQLLLDPNTIQVDKLFHIQYLSYSTDELKCL